MPITLVQTNIFLQALLNYISGLNIPGAVLIFLPGWNLIFALHKHLKMHPQFGENNESLLSPCNHTPCQWNYVLRIQKLISYETIIKP